jgi:NTP pyrophosphatase (non-canonical NTP hydrolase)
MSLVGQAIWNTTLGFWSMAADWRETPLRIGRTCRAVLAPSLFLMAILFIQIALFAAVLGNVLIVLVRTFLIDHHFILSKYIVLPARIRANVTLASYLTINGTIRNVRMKKKQTAQPIQAMEFRRADPEALAKFDPDTKRCTMNCGPHAKDTRTDKERKFLCDECITLTTKNIEERTMTETRNTHQRQILEWANNTFGKATADNTGERIRRFAEEAVELCQAVGLDEQAMTDIIEHVYAKMPGNVAQEIGQVGVSLLGLAEHLNIQADDEERKEFERLKSLPTDYWQARQNAKAEKGIALKSTPEESCGSFS